MKRRDSTKGPMQVTIDNRVWIRGQDIGSDLAQALVDRHTYRNPDYDAAAARSKWGPPKSIPRQVSTYRLDGQGVYSFPRGSWDEIRKRLIDEGLVFTEHSTRCLGDPGLRRELEARPFVNRFEQRPYQVDQVEAGAQHSTCLWRAPAGSGKTCSALMYAVRLQLPTLVVVPNREVFNQWVARCGEQLGLAADEVGVIQGSRRVVRPITIAMAQTLANHVDRFAETFGVFIADEVQRHGAKTFSEVSDRIHAYYRLGVSADERRADGKEFLVYDIFGPVRHLVSKESLIETGHVIDAEVRVIPTRTDAPWYRRIKGRARAAGGIQARLALELARDEDRNDTILRILRWCRADGEPTIVLGWRIEQAKVVEELASQDGMRTGLLLGGDENQADRQDTSQLLAAGRLDCALGTYQAVGVGFDLPAVSRGVFAAPCANNDKARMQFSQFAGRFERPAPGKKTAVVYYVWDPFIFGERPIRNLAKWRRDVVVLHDDRWVPVREYLKLGITTDPDEQDSTFDGLM